ncbi:hypothetical protein CRE_15780 [Caenorhabditis remanei]|uniref:WW domain-containing protein n=1 Tax=Caenorhabditis remanei TaxID=31234 RepID=E3NM85_CAERE|nr:hypothetical protein CRE_15780 [Caenorhabditis remanei]
MYALATRNHKNALDLLEVWFANNKISLDNHERGEGHKAKLQQRIRETMQKGKKQELADMKLNGTLAKMEAAAAASMARHGEGVLAGPSLPPTGLFRMNIFDPTKHKDVGAMAKEMASRREAGAVKRGAATAVGGAPDLKISKGDVVSAYRDLTNPNAAGPALPEHLAVGYMPETQVQCAEIAWVRAKNPDGPGSYYWNLFDNSTRWDTPNHFYTEKQYEQKCRDFEEQRTKNYYGMDEVQVVRSGKKDVESYIKSQIAASGLTDLVESNRKEQNYKEYRPPSDGRKLTKEQKKALWEERRREKEQKWREREAEEEKKRKEMEGNREEEEISDEEEDGSEVDDEEEEEFEIVGTPEREAMLDEPYEEMLEAPPPSQKPEKMPEIGLIEPPKPSFISPENAPQARQSIPAAPYGAWIKVEKTEKTEIFESPLTARFREEEAERVEEEEKKRAEEPKFEFGEKTATVMTKKVKGPIEFKKKSGNRNIRKRED